jgi:hypothetical protein
MNTKLLEIPIVYKAELILAKKRKARLYNVIEKVIFEVETINNLELAFLTCFLGDGIEPTFFPTYKTDNNFVSSVSHIQEYSLNELSDNIKLISYSLNNDINPEKKIEVSEGFSFSNSNDIKQLEEEIKKFKYYFSLDKNTNTITVDKTIGEEDCHYAKKHISDNRQEVINNMQKELKKCIISNGKFYQKINEDFNISLPPGICKNTSRFQSTIKLDYEEFDENNLIKEKSINNGITFPLPYINILKKYYELSCQEYQDDFPILELELSNANYIINNDIDYTHIVGVPEKIIFDAIKDIQNISLPYSRSGALMLLREKNLNTLLSNGKEQNYSNDSTNELMSFFDNIVIEVKNGKYDYKLDDDDKLYIIELSKIVKNIYQAIEYYYKLSPEKEVNMITSGIDHSRQVKFERCENIKNIYAYEDTFNNREITI